MSGIGWLRDGTEASLRSALAVVAPSLSEVPLRLQDRVGQTDPLYWSASAVLGEEFVVKYAWSEIRAQRLWREGVLLRRLRARVPGLPVPEVTIVSREPVLVVTRLVDGGPMSPGWLGQLDAAGIDRAAQDLAVFVVALHSVPSVALLDGLPEVEPTPQADTARLRSRYPRLVDDRRGSLVLGWCDWIDATLARASTNPAVVVHGDLHGYNQVWDQRAVRLMAVVDFEESGLVEPEYDLRYMPGNCPDPRLTVGVVDGYQHLGGRNLDVERVMAWHARTHLGDALWRTEAGVDLPGGGDAFTYVDDLARRFGQFGIET